MRASNLLISQFLLFSSLLYAQDSNASLEQYLSTNKQEQFGLDFEKNSAESSKLHDSWISPININYSYSRSNPYTKEQVQESASINLNQTIFQSGGIYFAIKYAEASKKYGNLSIDVAKRKMIKDALALLIQIKQSDLKIQRQEIQIDNAKIKLEQNKEQYLSGVLDSGFLDDAIIKKNVATQTLYDMQTAKERLISQFKVISDTDYKKLQIPNLRFITQEEFLADNIVLDMYGSDIQKNRYQKNVTTAKYLPKVSLTAGYNWSKSSNLSLSQNISFSNELNYYDYGFKVYMPLDINTFRDIESSRVDYLKSKLIVEDKKKEMLSLYEQVAQNINNYDKKIALSSENQALYEKLLKDTKKLFKVGYKSEYDVDLLQNSVDISKLDHKIFYLDKQLELLSLYEMWKQ